MFQGLPQQIPGKLEPLAAHRPATQRAENLRDLELLQIEKSGLDTGKLSVCINRDYICTILELQQLLVVDELHHLLAGSALEQRASLNLLKYLANERLPSQLSPHCWLLRRPNADP